MAVDPGVRVRGAGVKGVTGAGVGSGVEITVGPGVRVRGTGVKGVTGARWQ